MSRPVLQTPFRDRYEQARQLDPDVQLRECADYLQNPEVLILEFLESYHLIERHCGPDDFGLQADKWDAEAGDELVLEEFYESLEVAVREPEGLASFTCMCGALDPLRGSGHPALSRCGLDYVGVPWDEDGSVILGAVQTGAQETPYVLFLRLLNSLAELAPPIQLERLSREVVRRPLQADCTFDLHLVVSESPAGATVVALHELARDLADGFKRAINAEPQLRKTVRHVDCLHKDGNSAEVLLTRTWRI